ncbi:MAG: hypothetical protein Q9M17_06965 [Mariprofundus sp.]|nr:hypothetical protein [Mariprofundus sp.]
MSDQRVKNSEGENVPKPGLPDPNGDLKRLKELLLGEETKKIDVLQEHLENPELHAGDVGRVLHQAAQLNQQQLPGALADALSPVVESSLYASVRKNPDRLGDALFPVMMPAIRKSIISIMSGMVQSLNQMLENSFSWQGLKWRLESIQTGKSFAEIVMYHTLDYRVEQVFLIHKEDGSMLQHVSFMEEDSENADLVSSMLTAIQDFVRDSFQVEENDSIEKLNIGNMVVNIESGSKAVLAAVVRGNAPTAFNETLQLCCESIHKQMAAELNNFDGDASVFNAIRPRMESCLISQTATPPSKPNLKAKLVLAALAVMLVGWTGLSWYQAEREKSLIQALDALSGVVVIRTTHEQGALLISGLRDPLANNADALLHQYGISKDDVVFMWTPYQSLEPDIQVKRIKRLLKPDAKTQIQLDGSTLIITGMAHRAWLKQANTLLALAGISEIRSDTLVLSDSSDYLLQLAAKQLQPPETVHLSMLGETLIAAGKASHVWLTKAATAVDTIAGIKAFDASKVLNMQSDSYLLSESIRLLQPPSTVHLNVQDALLAATGKASQAWIRKTTKAAALIPDIKAYDDSKLVDTESNAYLLKKAERLLKPPASVRLSIKRSRLTAKGEASSKWIKNAHKQAQRISGIKGFDTRHLIDTGSNAYVLAKIRRELQPPESVNLKLQNHQLIISGIANAAWAKRAGKLTLGLDGVNSVWMRKLVVIEKVLAPLKTELRNTELRFVAHSNQFMDGETLKIKRLAQQLIKQSDLLRVTQAHVKVTGYSRLLGGHASALALSRATMVKRELVKNGLASSQVKTSGLKTRKEGWAAQLDLIWSPLK